MRVKKTDIFLFSGQVQKEDGSSVPEQRVVVAKSDELAIKAINESDPMFRTVGYATLADYEKCVSDLRAVATGSTKKWKLVIAR